MRNPTVNEEFSREEKRDSLKLVQLESGAVFFDVLVSCQSNDNDQDKHASRKLLHHRQINPQAPAPRDGVL